MKKITTMLLAMVLLLSVSACSKDISTLSSETTTPTSQISNTTTTSITNRTNAPTTAKSNTTRKSVTTTDATTTTEKNASKTGPSWGPKIILNGKELDVYTSHYFWKDDYLEIPLSAFLKSLGADYADSPYTDYEIECYYFCGKQYIICGKYHLFMLEEDYTDFIGSVNTLTSENTAEVGLLPRNKNICWINRDDSVVEWGEIWIDHISLMKALQESGISISIVLDKTANTITVTLPSPKE